MLLRTGGLLFCAGIGGALYGLWMLATSGWAGVAVAAGGVAISSAGVWIAAREKRTLWQPVLDAELAKWRSHPVEEVRTKLSSGPFVYEVAGPDGTAYQVEVELLRTAAEGLVMISVDDGTLPASILPAGATFALESEERTGP